MKRTARPDPDLTGSTLVPLGDGRYVDSVTGMVLSRLGWVNAHGYEQIHLGPGITAGAHRVVWEAVNGQQIPPGLTINHIDCDRANNRPENLELATAQEQIDHMVRLGRHRHEGGRPRGAPGSQAKLTHEDVEELQHSDLPVDEVARQFGISRSQAYRLRRLATA